MIIGAEVALLIIGIYALVTGKFMTTKKAKHIVKGWPARCAGVICLLPMPLSFMVATAVASLLVMQGKPVTKESFFWVGTAIEGSIVLVCAIAAGIISRIYRVPVAPPAGQDSPLE